MTISSFLSRFIVEVKFNQQLETYTHDANPYLYDNNTLFMYGIGYKIQILLLLWYSYFLIYCNTAYETNRVSITRLLDDTYTKGMGYMYLWF